LPTRPPKKPDVVPASHAVRRPNRILSAGPVNPEMPAKIKSTPNARLSAWPAVCEIKERTHPPGRQRRSRAKIPEDALISLCFQGYEPGGGSDQMGDGDYRHCQLGSQTQVPAGGQQTGHTKTTQAAIPAATTATRKAIPAKIILAWTAAAIKIPGRSSRIACGSGGLFVFPHRRLVLV
jgi:hypothetical protein